MVANERIDPAGDSKALFSFTVCFLLSSVAVVSGAVAAAYYRGASNSSGPLDDLLAPASILLIGAAGAIGGHISCAYEAFVRVRKGSLKGSNFALLIMAPVAAAMASVVGAFVVHQIGLKPEKFESQLAIAFVIGIAWEPLTASVFVALPAGTSRAIRWLSKVNLPTHFFRLGNDLSPDPKEYGTPADDVRLVDPVSDACKTYWNPRIQDPVRFAQQVFGMLSVDELGNASSVEDLCDSFRRSPLWTELPRGDCAAALQCSVAGGLVVGLLTAEDMNQSDGQLAIVVNSNLSPVHGRYPAAYWVAMTDICSGGCDRINRAFPIPPEGRRPYVDRIRYFARELSL